MAAGPPLAAQTTKRCQSLPPAPRADPYHQAAAALLWWWLVVGWLIPTLVLMLPGLARRTVAQRALRGSPCSGAAASTPADECARGWQTGAALEKLLVGLIEPPPSVEAEPDGHAGIMNTGLLCLRWVALLGMLWMLCSAVAPLYQSPGAALAA